MKDWMQFPVFGQSETYPLPTSAARDHAKMIADDRRIFEEMQAEGKLVGATFFPMFDTRYVEMKYWNRCHTERDYLCDACNHRIRKNASRVHLQFAHQYAILCLNCAVEHGWYGFFTGRHSYRVAGVDERSPEMPDVLYVKARRAPDIFEGHQPCPISPQNHPLTAYRATMTRRAKRHQQQEQVA